MGHSTSSGRKNGAGDAAGQATTSAPSIEALSRALYYMNGVSMTRQEMEKRLDKETLDELVAEAWESYEDFGDQSVFTVGRSANRFIVDFAGSTDEAERIRAQERREEEQRRKVRGRRG